ncbi:MAG: type II toxin-antitoxin system VapC family toxin [Bacteroidetes bacterium]|nr:type II toxin-antitoxin system VapC family toxin [Bacteroidota bacterium]
MEYLLDTHALLWYLDGSSALPGKLAVSLDRSEKLIVSIVSLWEITIKSSLGKIELAFSLEQIRDKMSADGRFKMLDISFDHLISLNKLPHYHHDPFDRLLIAQGTSENLTIVSADKHFAAYPIKVLWQI